MGALVDDQLDAVRAEALASWRSLHDPQATMDEVSLIGAAKVATVIQGEHGATFHPVRFRELAEFISELPF